MSSGDDKSPFKRLVAAPKANLAQSPTLVIKAPQSAPKQQTEPITGNKQDWMRAAGIPESDWRYVDYIVSKESGWNPSAVNTSSGACGLLQQLPCGKWSHTWNDPVGALIDGTGYAKSRYGSWTGAYSAWLRQNWW